MYQIDYNYTTMKFSLWFNGKIIKTASKKSTLVREVWKRGGEITDNEDTIPAPLFVQDIEGLISIPQYRDGTQADIDEGGTFGYYYGDTDLCEFANEGGCDHDGILWSMGDMGSPYFCTTHYFPQEQLGYELIEGAL